MKQSLTRRSQRIPLPRKRLFTLQKRLARNQPLFSINNLHPISPKNSRYSIVT